MIYRHWQSPLGNLHLVADDGGLRALAFDANWERVAASLGEWRAGNHPLLAQVICELGEYFAGQRKSFSVRLAPRGTEFQNKVWRALEKIPYGETCTYGEQAGRIRSPKAVRAVGTANGRNPICILLPCHRVVGASGALTGYAGGLAAKKALLALEGTSR